MHKDCYGASVLENGTEAKHGDGGIARGRGSNAKPYLDGRIIRDVLQAGYCGALAFVGAGRPASATMGNMQQYTLASYPTPRTLLIALK